MSIIETEEQSGVLIIHLTVPRMDTMQSSKFKKELEPFVKMNREKIILNLAQTDYLDSSTLGIFRKFAVELSGRGGQLILCNLKPPVVSILKISRLELLFQIEADIPAAIAAK